MKRVMGVILAVVLLAAPVASAAPLDNGGTWWAWLLDVLEIVLGSETEPADEPEPATEDVPEDEPQGVCLPLVGCPDVLPGADPDG